MCGIGGIINANLQRDELERRLRAMQTALHHRGPDDQGIYVAPTMGTGFTVTRLAILDLTAAGHQPMASADGRYHIVFNGEIYNFMALREELERAGETFISRSDTEVILKMYARHGPDCVREFKGMFAFAIWGERERACLLARDHFGVKPLYYHDKGGVFVMVIEWLHGEGVPREETRPLTLIPNREREHPFEFAHTVWAVARIHLQDHFCVGTRDESFSRAFQLLTEGHEIVDLPVKDDVVPAIGRC